VLLEALLAVALAAPAVRVAVEGDKDAVELLRARLSAAGFSLADASEADVFVRVHVREGRLHVVVEDRRGVLVDRLIDEPDPEEARVASWLAVRDAIDRATVAAPATPPFSLEALVDTAPDPTFAASSFWPVGVDLALRLDLSPLVRVVAGAGYDAGFSSSATLHALDVHAGAELHAAPWSSFDVAIGARASTTPSLVVAKNALGGGVGAAVGAYGRAAIPFSANVAGVVEAGVEARVVRELVLTDAGDRSESPFAVPVGAGVEVRF
jgi:hypothetical protein